MRIRWFYLTMYSVKITHCVSVEVPALLAYPIFGLVRNCGVRTCATSFRLPIYAASARRFLLQGLAIDVLLA